MTILQTVILKEVVCGTCGITHAVPADWINNRRANKGDIYCPNGCCRTWKKSDADRLREQLEIKERELRMAKCEALNKQVLIDSERQAREKAERKLKRVKNGVCPCCQRSFENLKRHMATQHPEVK